MELNEYNLSAFILSYLYPVVAKQPSGNDASVAGETDSVGMETESIVTIIGETDSPATVAGTQDGDVSAGEENPQDELVAEYMVIIYPDHTHNIYPDNSH